MKNSKFKSTSIPSVENLSERQLLEDTQNSFQLISHPLTEENTASDLDAMTEHKSLTPMANSKHPSLLKSLRKYTPGDGNDPLENFITEAFAWQLNSHPTLADYFLTKVMEHLGGTTPVSVSGRAWNTQINLAGKRPDMVLETSSMAFIFEHKAWVHLHENQLSNYRQRAAQRYGENRFRIILITAHQGQHQQQPDVAFCWRHVHAWIHEWAAVTTEDAFHPIDFCEMLEDVGLGPPAPISHEAILGFYPSLGLVDRLQSAANKFMPWMKSLDFPGVNPQGSTNWGRVGLGLFPEGDWLPSLFVGFLVHPKAHNVSLANPCSPDFSIIADFSQHLKEKIEDHPLYEELVHELSEQIPATGFDFHHHLRVDPKPNRWHPFHIRRPLLDVLRGTKTSEEQDKQLRQEACKVLNIVLGCTAFRSLREVFARSK